MRFLLPILVLAYVAPFVAGPERLLAPRSGAARSRPARSSTSRRGRPPPSRVRPTTTRTRRTGADGPARAARGWRVRRRRRGRDGRAPRGSGRGGTGGRGPRIVLVPTAVARHRPDLAVGQRGAGLRGGRRACRHERGDRRRRDPRPRRRARSRGPWSRSTPPTSSTSRAATPTSSRPCSVTPRRGPRSCGHTRAARASRARAPARWRMAERCWTRDGVIDGLGLLPGFAVLPHYAPGRLAGWRDAAGRTGADSRGWASTSRRWSSGRPGGEWRVAGRGRAHVIPPPGRGATRSAGPGELLEVG